MTLAFVVDYALKNLSSLELGELPTVVLGLIFGQISKYLNSSK